MDALPSTRHLLTSLINTIATSTSTNQHPPPNNQPNNPLASADQNTKNALLTLHTLFPNDFLPALDLLDRGLVTRFVLASPPQTSAPEQEDIGPIGRQSTVAYYVRTAQQPSSRSRFRNAEAQSTTSYEVRLKAWSCSCPAFAFATFPAGVSTEEDTSAASPTDGENREDGRAEIQHDFGGLTRGDDVPACKHLLACMLAEKCEGFERLVETKVVGIEEIAGWAAGWAAGWGD